MRVRHEMWPWQQLLETCRYCEEVATLKTGVGGLELQRADGTRLPLNDQACDCSPILTCEDHAGFAVDYLFALPGVDGTMTRSLRLTWRGVFFIYTPPGRLLMRAWNARHSRSMMD